MFCHKCGKELSDNVRSCPTCGTEIPFTRDRSALSTIAGLVLSAIKGGLALFGVLCFAVVFYFAYDFFTSINPVTPEASFTALPAAPPATTTLPASTPAAVPARELPGPAVTLPIAIGEIAPSTEMVSRNYSWTYRGKWNWEMKLPVSLYDYYRKLPRPPTNNYSVYVTHPLDDPYIDMLVGKIRNIAKGAGYTEFQTVEFAAAFVQSLPYTVDSVTTPYDEYPRYPVETLVDNGGDCEDTSILLASILDRMGYGVVLLNPPNHLGVGVKGSVNMSGSYWEHEGGKYYYIETTGQNWGIGQLPDKYKNTAASIYPIVPVPIVVHEGSIKSNRFFADVELKISNLGTAPAANVTVLAGFDAGEGMLWISQQVAPFALGIGQQTTVELNLRIPLREHTRIVVQIVVDGVLVDESFSNWFDT